MPTDEAHLPEFQRDATSFRYDRWHGWWHLEQGIEWCESGSREWHLVYSSSIIRCNLVDAPRLSCRIDERRWSACAL